METETGVHGNENKRKKTEVGNPATKARWGNGGKKREPSPMRSRNEDNVTGRKRRPSRQGQVSVWREIGSLGLVESHRCEFMSLRRLIMERGQERKDSSRFGASQSFSPFDFIMKSRNVSS